MKISLSLFYRRLSPRGLDDLPKIVHLVNGRPGTNVLGLLASDSSIFSTHTQLLDS